MTFKNLEQRFTENTNKLYAAAKNKFENGRASIGINDDPLIVRSPGDGYWNMAESRSTPIVSAANDVKRLTLFTASSRGIKFLAKQQILQTGNTFEATRVINPVFHISNATPFLHTNRALDLPITGRGIGRQLLGNNALSRRIFGSGEQKKDVESLRKIGQLQNETYNKAINRKDLIGGVLKKIPVIGQTVSAARAKRSVGDGIYEYKESRPELATSREIQAAGKALSLVGNALGDPMTGLLGQTLSLFDVGYIMTKHRGDNTKFQKNQTTIYNPKYGPSLLAGTYETYLTLTNNKKDFVHGNVRRGVPGPKSENIIYGTPFSDIVKTDTKTNLLNRYRNQELFKYDSGFDVDQTIKLNKIIYRVNTTQWHIDNTDPNISVDTVPYLKYFSADKEAINKQDTFSLDARARARDSDGKRKKISYLKDPANETASPDTYNAQNVQVPYKFINGAQDSFDDPITVSFSMGKDSSIRFRAFIKDLQQSITPQYNAFQYIGRIEKFINYTSVQREISFKLGVIAFSESELENVWTRINYLTGLVFPYGFNRGIHQPNILRLTIGNVFTDQPGYIASLNTNFNELSESWDIDREVPISAQMDIKFIIIEKATKIAESPFYGITEQMSNQFSETIRTPEKILESLDPKKAPVVSPVTTKVDSKSNTINIPTPSVAPKPVIPTSVNTNTILGGFTGLGRPVNAGGLTNPFRGSGG